MDPPIWLYAGALCYAAAMAYTFFRLLKGQNPTAGCNLFLVLSGFALQSFGLWALGLRAGSCPIRNPFEILHFISWSIMLVYWLTGSVFRMSLLGVGSACLAALLAAIAPLFSSELPERHLFGGNHWIEAHAALALLSYGAFGILAVSGALYMLQNYSLKQKSCPSSFRHLPSLSELNQVILRLLVISIILYATSVALGAVFWTGDGATVSPLKIITTTGLLTAYILVLILRIRRKLVGFNLAVSVTILFGLALLTLGPVEEHRQSPRTEQAP